MKKAFAWVALLAAVLCTACQPAATSQGGTTTTAGSTGIYLKADPANGEAYNAAITAYDAFLSGNQPAGGQNGVSEIYIDQFTRMDGNDGIDAFGLLDVNGDNIPELHTRSTHLDVFTFENGKVIHLHTAPVSYLNGTVLVTEGGTIFGKKTGVETAYFVTAYSDDGFPVTVSFDCLNTGETTLYHLGGEVMEREAWEAATAAYRALETAPEAVTWTTWTAAK